MSASQATKGATWTGGHWFATTHWSVVLAASAAGSEGQVALEKLCGTYWNPIYAYLRRQGYDVPDAQDVTQAFFAHLLEHRFPACLDKEKGKCRSFLLTALKHFLGDQADHRRALKRGAGQVLVSLDVAQGEAGYRAEPVDSLDAERLYERRWAITLLSRVLDRLQAEFVASGKGGLFGQLQPFLVGDKGTDTYAALAQRLQTTEGALKVTVHRMRRRYRSLLREEVANTVATPAEVEAEIQHLLTVISG